MAHLSDLAYDHLAWCTTWYLREDTLKAAFTALVNYHHTRTDVFSILPAAMETADMVPDVPGLFLLHCQVDDHHQAGMVARYEVQPAQAGGTRTP